MLSPELLFAFLLLGAFVGFMAGLLGIGGGGIMVPVLTALFLSQGFPLDTVLHVALGTTMAAIIMTSLSSLRAHHKKEAVRWEIVKAMAPGIIIGTFLSTFLVASLSTRFLALFFSLFMAYIAFQLFIDKQAKPSRRLASRSGLLLAGTGIGGISALVSIGGGSLTVPFLCWQNIPLKKAIGTSAAIGLPLSIAGTLGYLINGWGSTELEYTLGFIYLPAVLLISTTSFIMAPYGAKLAHKLPTPILKKAFAILLIILSIKMLMSIL